MLLIFRFFNILFLHSSVIASLIIISSDGLYVLIKRNTSSLANYGSSLVEDTSYTNVFPVDKSIPDIPAIMYPSITS